MERFALVVKGFFLLVLFPFYLAYSLYRALRALGRGLVRAGRTLFYGFLCPL